uniref:Uncharacterized protein n=1 Tax=Arundo donax TaxID=35708 RepID=A0A0A9E381_ARUDO
MLASCLVQASRCGGCWCRGDLGDSVVPTGCDLDTAASVRPPFPPLFWHGGACFCCFRWQIHWLNGNSTI